MSDWYILDGKMPVKVDMMEGAQWFEKHRLDRVVAQTSVGDAQVSTVFLGLDHQFDPDGPPLVFETLIFDGPHDEDMWRYSTWDEALKGHEATVEMLRKEQQ